MSKVRDLTEITALDDADLFYVVDFSAGPNGGRKITKANLKETIIPESISVEYNNADSTLVATNVKAAIDELDGKAVSNKTKVDKLERAWLQYSKSVLQTNSTTTYAAVQLLTDNGSVPGSFLTKSSATQFRANFNGYIKCSYHVVAYVDTNDRGIGFRIAKNGTAVSYTVGQIWGKNQVERTGSTHGCFIISCATNDLFTLEFASLEGGVTSTIPVNGATFCVETYRIDS